MKKVLTITIMISMVIALSVFSGGCFSSDDDSNNSTPDTGTGMGVYDNNGTFLGYNLSTDNEFLWLLTATGNMYQLLWDGNLQDGYILYDEADCNGIPYAPEGTSMLDVLSGKTVFYSKYKDKLYKIKTFNADGTGNAENVTVLSSSYFNSCSNSTLLENVIELEETTRSAVGIPDTIIPPFTFDFGN